MKDNLVTKTWLRQCPRLGVAGMLLMAATACGSGGSGTYDIGPIFPLTKNKCAKYNGKESGSGLSSQCLVGAADCKRAAADWLEATRNLPDAIRFTC